MRKRDGTGAAFLLSLQLDDRDLEQHRRPTSFVYTSQALLVLNARPPWLSTRRQFAISTDKRACRTKFRRHLELWGNLGF